MDENEGVSTYKELLEYLQTLTPEQLEQRIMVLPPDVEIGGNDEVVDLLPVFAIGSVKSLYEDTRETRSADDWNHHPEQIVICTDCNPFDGEGNDAFELVEDENGNILWKGNNTNKLYER